MVIPAGQLLIQIKTVDGAGSGLDSDLLHGVDGSLYALKSEIGGGGTVTSVNASGGTTGLTFSGGPITSSGTITLAGTLAVANGGTGATDAASALTALGAYAASNPSGYTSNTGTVTSVNVAGGATGLTFTGGPITSSGSITIGGTLALASGGTGATTAAGARTNLGLGTMAVEAAADYLPLTGGTLTGKVTVDLTGNSAEFGDGSTTDTWISTNGQRLRLGLSGTTGYLAVSVSRSLAFTTNGAATPQMVISAAGDVGIGTASPSEKLDVSGNIKASNIGIGIAPTTALHVRADGGASTGSGIDTLTVDNVRGYNWNGIHIGGYSGYGPSGGYSKIRGGRFSWGRGLELVGQGNIEGTDQAVIRLDYDVIRFRSSGGEKVTMLSSGNLGVGTTSPAETLDVSGNIAISGTKVIGTQGAAVADATDAASAITQLNALLARMRDHGLIAT